LLHFSPRNFSLQLFTLQVGVAPQMSVCSILVLVEEGWGGEGESFVDMLLRVMAAPF